MDAFTFHFAAALLNHIDVAFRIAIGQTLKDSSLIIRPFKSAHLSFYASPDYIKEYGLPASPDELKHHNVLRFRAPDGQIYSQLELGSGQKKVEVSGNLVINSAPLSIEAGLQGRGIMFIPEDIANHYVEKGELVRLFEDIEPSVNFGWLVYPSRTHMSLTARTFIDFMMSNVENNASMIDESEDIRRLLI